MAQVWFFSLKICSQGALSHRGGWGNGRGWRGHQRARVSNRILAALTWWLACEYRQVGQVYGEGEHHKSSKSYKGFVVIIGEIVVDNLIEL